MMRFCMSEVVLKVKMKVKLHFWLGAWREARKKKEESRRSKSFVPVPNCIPRFFMLSSL